MKLQARHTVYSCYLGYVTQAIVNNLPPLLFLTFNREFGVSLDKISLLITVNFCIQILVDFLSPGVIKRTGYRKAALCSFQTHRLPKGRSVFLPGDHHRTYRLLLPSLPSGSLYGNPDLYGI